MCDQIELPEADQLDTGDVEQNSGYKQVLYLIPVEENDGEKPRVTTHSGYGNIGTPMKAHNGRMVRIGSYGPQTVGSSVRELLEDISDVLVEYAARYEGTKWDGSNHVGQWDIDDLFDGDGLASTRVRWPLTDAWNNNEHLLSHYYHAGDWFGPAGIHWEELCDEADIDPERAFDEDLSVLAEIIEANIQEHQDQKVVGTAYYAELQGEEWLDNHNGQTA